MGGPMGVDSFDTDHGHMAMDNEAYYAQPGSLFCILLVPLPYTPALQLAYAHLHHVPFVLHSFHFGLVGRDGWREREVL